MSTEEQTNSHCAICGGEIDPYFAPYPNPVCRLCDKRAINAKGKKPFVASTKDPFVDDGDNPVFIDGLRCWRRYKFGGYVTMRDPDNCRTLAEFYHRHHSS